MLLNELSVLQNVSWVGRLRGLSPKNAMLRSEEALEWVGLGEIAHRPVFGLSGGEAQRVGIARSIVGAPGLLVADEPTSALDVATSHSVALLLAKSGARLGIPVVVASHDPIFTDYADQRVHLEDGVVQVKEDC